MFNSKRKPKEFFIGVHFHGKGTEMINIAGMLHSKAVTIPVLFSDKDTLVVSCN